MIATECIYAFINNNDWRTFTVDQREGVIHALKSDLARARKLQSGLSLEDRRWISLEIGNAENSLKGLTSI